MTEVTDQMVERAVAVFEREYRRIFPRGGDEQDHEEAITSAVSAVLLDLYGPPTVFMDGNRITPGTEECVCTATCEFPCWQRIGITEDPCCAGCPPL